MAPERSLSDNRLAISLPPGTWLVLFEYLAHSYEVWRGENSEKSDDTFVLQKPDGGERIALWHLEGAIESTLPEIFAANYRDLILLEKQRLISGQAGPQLPQS